MCVKFSIRVFVRKLSSRIAFFFFFLSFLTFLCVFCTIILSSFSGTDWGCEPPADLQDRMRNSLDAVANDGGARKRRRGWCVIRAFSGSSNELPTRDSPPHPNQTPLHAFVTLSLRTVCYFCCRYDEEEDSENDDDASSSSDSSDVSEEELGDALGQRRSQRRRPRMTEKARLLAKERRRAKKRAAHREHAKTLLG